MRDDTSSVCSAAVGSRDNSEERAVKHRVEQIRTRDGYPASLRASSA